MIVLGADFSMHYEQLNMTFFEGYFNVSATSRLAKMLVAGLMRQLRDACSDFAMSDVAFSTSRAGKDLGVSRVK